MTSALQSVTLTVVSGDTSEPTRTFEPGKATGPISVGADGDWKINGAGVNARHLYFAFDGAKLHVAAASPSSRALLRGKIVEQDWGAVEIPSEVHFGAACIIVLSDGNTSLQELELRALDDEALDDEAITVFRQDPFDAPDADSPTCALTAPVSVHYPSMAALATEMKRAPIEVVAEAHSPRPLEPDTPTHCDNGALREFASQIASMAATKLAAASLPLERLASAELPNHISPTGKLAAVTRAEPSANTRTVSEVSKLVKRLISAWRLASRPQRAICALLPFALCTGLRSPASGASASAMTAGPELARPAENAVGIPAAAQAHKSPQLIEATIASTVTPTPVEAELTPASSVVAREEALAKPSGTPSAAARIPEVGPSLANAATAQRDALSAARTGKLSEAAELYQKLAAASQSKVFARAALLARRQSVRTP